MQVARNTTRFGNSESHIGAVAEAASREGIEREFGQSDTNFVTFARPLENRAVTVKISEDSCPVPAFCRRETPVRLPILEPFRCIR